MENFKKKKKLNNVIRYLYPDNLKIIPLEQNVFKIEAKTFSCLKCNTTLLRVEENDNFICLMISLYNEMQVKRIR